MAGENKLAKDTLQNAVSTAEADKSMCPDTLLLAFVSSALRELSKTRSRTDLEMYLEYDLENLVDSDMVITRGC